MNTSVMSSAQVSSSETRLSDRELADIEDSRRDIAAGWCALATFIILLFGVAAVVRLDAAAIAYGEVVVAGEKQIVQSRDGGTVSALEVREGEHVNAGQTLIETASPEIVGAKRSLSSQLISLEAERARIVSERLGRQSVEVPSEFAELRGAERVEAQRAILLESTQMIARKHSLEDQISVLHQQAAASRYKVDGLSQQIQASQDQRALIDDELGGMRDLAAKGFASKNRVRDLERTAAAGRAEMAELTATAAEAREQTGAARVQADSVISDYADKLADDERRVEQEIADLTPRLQQADAAAEHTRIKATASGRIIGLDVSTVGAVLEPGQTLMYIVPDRAELIVRARIAPADANDIIVGQQAEMRLTALHERNLPILLGTVSNLSADRLTDEKSGASYFVIEVRAKNLLKRRGASGQGIGIIPGLPVEVRVRLRKRTMLQYLIEPFDQAFWRSMRQN